MVNAGPRQLPGRFGIPSSNVMNRAECTIPCRLRRISSRSLVYRVAAFSAALCRQRAVAGRGDAGQEPALAKAGVPDTIAFQTKPEIALEQIKSAYAAGLPQGVVLMDAGYGNDTDLRTQVTALGLSYVAGIGANTAVWPPGTAPLPPLPGSGRGRPPKLLRRDGEHPPGQRQDARPRAAARGLAQHRLARGQRGLAGLALPPPAGAAGASRHVANLAARRGVGADLVAARRALADQILAFHDGR